jgi:hypothetical protein
MGGLAMDARTRKTYEEMAAEADAIKDTEAEIDGLVPVSARVAENLTSVFSVRFGPGELAQITKAAEAQGLKVGAFIRAVALAAAQDDLETPRERTRVRREAAEHVRALGDLVGRL